MRWEKRQVCDIDKIEIGTQLFEVKLCAACRTQQVVCKSSRSKRRGARCIGDRVGVLPNGSMHPDVPASTFVVVKLTGGLRTTSSPPVLPESQAVRRGMPPYSESRGTCPRMACAGRPSADRKKGNMTLTVWTGWTTSSAALQAAAAVADFFFS